MTEREDIAESIAQNIARNRKRAVLIGAGALVALALTGWGIAAALSGAPAVDTTEDLDVPTGLVEDSSSVPTSSYPMSTVTTDRPSDDAEEDADEIPGDGDLPDDETFVDAGMVAFRMGGEIWVADQDGTDARYVADLLKGAYSLSPDGTALAVVDGGTRILRIVEVNSGSYVEVGDAIADPPSWSPDSAWLAFTAPQGSREEVWRTDRSGEDARPIGTGSSPAVASDTVTVGFITESGSGPALWLSVVRGSDEEPANVQAPGGIADFAWTPTGVVYVMLDDWGISSIRAGTLDDLEGEQLVGRFVLQGGLLSRRKAWARSRRVDCAPCSNQEPP